ncbi:bZIP domain-containing protein [Phanerochaete sordida]|uniref:BZIP domain-containing protein n=1 Tax=Phanerochaete sordida TaxID=48140 RepID=A0A9P3G2H4_9APHY|nr:bZIP domain-containing protein [Phanerochaete sordida]
MSDEHPGLQAHMPSFPRVPNMPAMAQQQSMHQLPTQQLPANPVLQQAFVSWLQYMQVQMQLQQQQQQQHQQQQHAQQHQQQAAHLRTQQAQHQQQHAQSSNAPYAPNPFHSLPPIETSAPFQREVLSPEQTPAQATSTPSPMSGNEALDAEGSPIVLAEEKRRRNTAASARFRVKKKQWTLNLERSITDLSGRVEELEREAAELRRENGWLKEIVMLKSKRYGGPAPNLEPPAGAAQTGPSGASADAAESSANAGDEVEETSGAGAGDKGKEKEA